MHSKKPLKAFFYLLILINLTIWIGLFSIQKNKIFTINFVNVGNGDGIFITTPEDFRIVIDGGPTDKLANYMGINNPFSGKRIDLLIISHPHEDHIAGALEILKQYDVGMILGTGVIYQNPTYGEILSYAKKKNIDFIVGEQGETLKFGELNIEVIYPFESLNNKEISNINNSSLVFKTKYKNFYTLFLGDMEKDKGVELLLNGTDMRADVVKISHQGSKNGAQNLPKFLETVNPKIAVISVGENKFGHPNVETLDRLTYYGLKVLRTDIEGDISIESDGEKYWVK